MKKNCVIFLLTVCALLTAVPGLAQEGAVSTTVHFMNMNSSTWATVWPTFYDAGGNQVLVGDQVSLQGFGQGRIDLAGLAALESGQTYTMVLNSDQPLAAVTTRTNPALGDPVSMYGGTTPATRLYLPLIRVSAAEGVNARLNVANPGIAPIEMTAVFYTPDGSAFGSPLSQTLPANGHYMLDFANPAGEHESFDNFSGHAVIDLTGPGLATLFQATPDSYWTYNAHGNTGPSLNCPYADGTTTFYLQNPNPEAATVKCTYFDNTGNTVGGDPVSIPPWGSAPVTPPAFPGGTTWGGAFTCDQNIAGTGFCDGPSGPTAAFNLEPSPDGSSAMPCLGPDDWIFVRTETGGWSECSLYDEFGGRIAGNDNYLGPSFAYGFSMASLAQDFLGGGGMNTMWEGTGNWVVLRGGPGNAQAACGAVPPSRWSKDLCLNPGAFDTCP